MFDPAQVIETEVFARVPDRLRIKGRTGQWLEVQRRGRGQKLAETADCFLEGPSFDRDGNLYVVDIPYGRIFRISPSGEFDVVAEYDGEPNGLKIHKDGRFFIADQKQGILLLDPSTGTVRPYLDRPNLERFKGVNDLIFARNGDLYFTDQGMTGLHDPTGRLYRLRATGELDKVLVNVPSPNGLVLNGEETMVLLAVTRANAIWRVPLLQDGQPIKVGAFLNLSGGIGPDGLAIDEADNLAVCQVGLGVVWVFSDLGAPLFRIKSSTGHMVTNAAYGGPENRHLFITESLTGTVLRAELPIPGRKMFSHVD